MQLEGKPVRESHAEIVEVVLPNDANPLGTILGGKVLHLVDIVAAVAAYRHSRTYVVTAAMDHVDFRHPIRVGDLVILKSSVNRVFQTSMEVGVKVFSENILTGERRHTSSAYVTFVALDSEGQPITIPPVIPESEEEKRRYEQAEARRRYRLEQRARPR